jgi:hypothetical protein
MPNFRTIALALAVISIGMAGVMMAGAMLWPEQAERYKSQIPTVLIGLVLVGVSSSLIAAFGG